MSRKIFPKWKNVLLNTIVSKQWQAIRFRNSFLRKTENYYAAEDPQDSSGLTRSAWWVLPEQETNCNTLFSFLPMCLIQLPGDHNEELKTTPYLLSCNAILLVFGTEATQFFTLPLCRCFSTTLQIPWNPATQWLDTNHDVHEENGSDCSFRCFVQHNAAYFNMEECT